MLPRFDPNRFGDNIIDPNTGYSLTIPAVYQMPPYWWDTKPDAYRKVEEERAKRGIVVDDWDGGIRPVRDEPHPDLTDPLVKKFLERRRAA